MKISGFRLSQFNSIYNLNKYSFSYLQHLRNIIINTQNLLDLFKKENKYKGERVPNKIEDSYVDSILSSIVTKNEYIPIFPKEKEKILLFRHLNSRYMPKYEKYSFYIGSASIATIFFFPQILFGINSLYFYMYFGFLCYNSSVQENYIRTILFDNVSNEFEFILDDNTKITEKRENVYFKHKYTNLIPQIVVLKKSKKALFLNLNQNAGYQLDIELFFAALCTKEEIIVKI